MSADNGYILRKNDEGKFVLQMYFASADEYPPIENARPEEIFDDLEDAVMAFEALEDAGEYSEYGLTVRIRPIKTS